MECETQEARRDMQNISIYANLKYTSVGIG